MRGSIAIRAVLCGRYFFLSKQLIQNNRNMEVKQFIELYINSSEVEQINMLINMPTSGKMILIQQLIGGYRACQNEYEEKLRWIPVEEKLPEIREYSYQIVVKTKSSDRGSNLYRTVAIFSFETESIIERKIRGYIGWRYFL